MPTYPYELDDYAAEFRNKPFKNWMEGLRDIQGRPQIRVRLDRVWHGNLDGPHAVRSGVRELSIDCGPEYRVYFGIEGKRVILLLPGGDKSF